MLAEDLHVFSQMGASRHAMLTPVPKPETTRQCAGAPKPNSDKPPLDKFAVGSETETGRRFFKTHCQPR